MAGRKNSHTSAFVFVRLYVVAWLSWKDLIRCGVDKDAVFNQSYFGFKIILYFQLGESQCYVDEYD